jgi:hypothetical protein
MVVRRVLNQQVTLRFAKHMVVADDANITWAATSMWRREECARSMVLRQDCGRDLAWELRVRIQLISL